MAHTHVQYLADTRYRTTVKYVGNGVANTNVNSLDVSTLQGFQTGGIVNIAKIFWKTSGPSGGVDLIWDATSNVIAFICEGTGGTYGFMPGQPSISNNAAAANLTGDVLITNASATFTLVVEYHKVPLASGLGWSVV